MSLSDISTTTEVDFSTKWACSRGYGHMYGWKYIDAFKSNIVEMFNTGCQDKSFCIGAWRMLEKIKQKYPD